MATTADLHIAAKKAPSGETIEFDLPRTVTAGEVASKVAQSEECEVSRVVMIYKGAVMDLAEQVTTATGNSGDVVVLVYMLKNSTSGSCGPAATGQPAAVGAEGLIGGFSVPGLPDAADAEDSSSQHPRAARSLHWARNKSSDIQLTGAHVPLSAEAAAEIEKSQELYRKGGVLLAKTAVHVDNSPVTVTNIERYLFLDDGKKVKVYIELEGIGQVKDKVSCEFTSDTFDLVIHDDDSSVRSLKVDDLEHPINTYFSKFTVKSNKIIISLHKEVESPWLRLRRSAQ